MKFSTDYDSSWGIDYASATFSHANSVPEATKHLEVATAFFSTVQEALKGIQEEKRRDESREEQRQGQIMKEIYDIASRLGIDPYNDLPRMKGKKTTELEALSEDLKKRLDNRSRKKLSAA